MSASNVAPRVGFWVPSSRALLGEGVDNTEVDSNGSSTGNHEDSDVNLENITFNLDDSTKKSQDKNVQKRKKSNNDNTKLRSNKRRKVGGEEKGGIPQTMNRFDRLIDPVSSRITAQSNRAKGHTTDPGSIPNAIQLLDDLPDVSVGGDLYLFATRLFCKEEKRIMFSALKKSVRVIWLNNEFVKEGDI
ncbi:hypothetical protein CFOL_v3_35434 [Cephalotus follicularis]|uniref:Uncharacterized protein n=1 Tax=Cephalotus follicularis TaxID=3775 RepID=A0A1Q3DHS3_CEPFO|nr:hypothetical protein CFOL_v3_35434 [Cephalotus follicularis]